MASVLDVPALQGPPDIGTALQMIAEGLQERRKNREDETKRLLAQNIGGRLSSGDFQGAADTAFATGDLSTGLKIHELNLEQKKQFAETVVRHVAVATPETWPGLRQRLTELTGEDPGPDLEAAKADIMAESADLDTILSENERRGDREREDERLAMERERLRLAQEEAAGGAKPSAGFVRMPDGTLAFEPGGPADPAVIRQQAEARTAAKSVKPTEREARNAQLYKVVEPELTVVEKYFPELASLSQQAKSMLPGGNFLTSPGYQQARNSVQTIVASYLYSVSGATANPGEVATQSEILMPKPGDNKATVDNKLQRIRTMVDSIKNSNELIAGPEGTPTETAAAFDENNPPPDVDPEDWRFMTEEERALWQ